MDIEAGRALPALKNIRSAVPPGKSRAGNYRGDPNFAGRVPESTPMLGSICS
jgi:hypothetical protein